MQEGKARWCEFHADPHFGAVAWQEKRRVERVEREERERAEREKKKNSVRRLVKKVAHEVLFAV